MNANVKTVIGARPGSLGSCFAGLSLKVVSEEEAAAAQRAEEQRREALAAERVAAEAAAREAVEAEKAAAKQLKEQQDVAEAAAKAAADAAVQSVSAAPFVPKIVYMPSKDSVERRKGAEQFLVQFGQEVEFGDTPTLVEFSAMLTAAGFVIVRTGEQGTTFGCEGVEVFVPDAERYRSGEAYRTKNELFRQRKESQPTVAQFTLWVIAAGFAHVRDHYSNALYACEGVELEVYGGATTVAPKFAPKATIDKVSPERAARERRRAKNRAERDEAKPKKGSTAKIDSHSKGNNKKNAGGKKNK